jgi:hypothetical protein
MGSPSPKSLLLSLLQPLYLRAHLGGFHRLPLLPLRSALLSSLLQSASCPCCSAALAADQLLKEGPCQLRLKSLSRLPLLLTLLPRLAPAAGVALWSPPFLPLPPLLLLLLPPMNSLWSFFATALAAFAARLP